MTSRSPSAAPEAASAMVATRRLGRRVGPTESRGEILAAARRVFSERGYDAATMRTIAQAAKVDPALVHYFYGTKERLFVAALEWPFEPAEVLPHIAAGPRAEAGERLTRLFLRVWRDPDGREPMLAMLRSTATNEQAAAMLRQFIAAALHGPLVREFGISSLHVAAAAAHLVGLVMCRYVVEMEPVASASEEDLVALVAPVIQYYLDGGRNGKPGAVRSRSSSRSERPPGRRVR